MTRRHIEAIAAAIEHLQSLAPTRAEQIGINAAAMAVSRALEGINPSFDRARFLRDCGVN